MDCDLNPRECGMCELAFDENGEDYPSCAKASFWKRLTGSDLCTNSLRSTKLRIKEMKAKTRVAICGGNP